MSDIFSSKEMQRYSRHIAISNFNLEGQKKLKLAKVLVIGAGGLGCPLLQYLTAAGVGTIGIVDDDVVDESNLQRQVLYDVFDVGKPKVEVAQKKLKAMNPHIEIQVFKVKLTSQNAENIIKNFDIVADGTDNFPTRYLINDACVMLNKVNVYGSVFQFEGQVSVFNYNNGPNYRSLYPSPPPSGTVPNCIEGGVLGVLPGIVGCLQANEVIKIISGIGEPASGRLMSFDALTCTLRTFHIKKDENNPLNGENPAITQLVDYNNTFCETRHGQKEGSFEVLHSAQDDNLRRNAMKEISVRELKEKLDGGSQDIQVIDVREPFEFDIVNLGAALIPMSKVKENPQILADAIQKDKQVIIHCKSGGRSGKAVQLMEEKYQFKNLYNLQGGILEYIREIDPSLPSY